MMFSIQALLFLLLTVALALSQNDEDKGRPYEFGFTVDGQQHRHEKKDEKGIIQGEFGFITADGVYHVTVYATDENGNFRILSMKNIRISAPLDGSPATGPISPDAGKYLKSQPNQQSKPEPLKPMYQPQPLSLTPNEDKIQNAATTRKPLRFTTQPTIKPACAGCGYVTTPKPASGQSFPFKTPQFKEQDEQKLQINHQSKTQQTTVQQNTEFGRTSYQGNGQQDNVSFGAPQNTNPAPQSFQNAYSQLPNAAYQVNTKENFQEKTHNSFREQNLVPQQFQKTEYPVVGSNGNLPGDVSGIGGNGAVPNPLALPGVPGAEYPQEEEQQQLPKFPPVSVDKDVIHVDGKTPLDIPIKDKFPGMQAGLPEGVDEKDITNLLYKFHYTVGFHGHYEKGLKNGAKIGGYFVNGRDGISRVVTYVADENGFRPKFKFVNLGLDSEDTPKEETEKKFGLKSFEFVWYPVE